jgi:hypothetical protein
VGWLDLKGFPPIIIIIIIIIIAAVRLQEHR